MTEEVPGIPPPEETVKKEPRIRSSGQLAEALGFVRDPDERVSSSWRSYEKPTGLALSVQRVQGIQDVTGYATMEFIDATRRGSSVKEEDIIIGARWGKNPSAWGVTMDGKLPFAMLPALRDRYPQLQLMVGPNGSLDRNALLENGYQQLLPVLRTLEESGYYRERLQRMEENITRGEALICEILVPMMREHFPEYHHVDDKYLEHGQVLFYPDSRNNKPTVPVIDCDVASTRTHMVLTRAKLTEDGSIDHTYFHNRERYGIKPLHPEIVWEGDTPLTGWRYGRWDFDEARQALDQGLAFARGLVKK